MCDYVGGGCVSGGMNGLLNLKSCDFQCRLIGLLCFTPCDVKLDDVIIEYKEMIVSLKNYCKQLKARIALMQKNFDCAFTTALQDRIAKVKCEVEHAYSIRLKEEMRGYRAKLDSHYCHIIQSQLDTWHGIAEGHLELLPQSVHDLQQAQIDMLQCRHEQYVEELESEAVRTLEVTRHDYNTTIGHLEHKMVQMHQHHLECLLRLKRRFLCSPEEINNCSDLEFWRIPEVPVEDECCGIDHYVPNYSRWEALSVELQSLPLDEQISVLVHASLTPNVIGQFIAQSDKSYTNAVVLHLCNFLGENGEQSGMFQPSISSPNCDRTGNSDHNNEDSSCFCNVNNCTSLKTAIRSGDFIPSRGDLVALLCKVTQADRSFVINYILSTQSCITLQPAAFIKQFSGHCSVKQQMEIIEMMREELGPLHSTCGGSSGLGGCGDAANPFSTCVKPCGSDLCDNTGTCESCCSNCSNQHRQCTVLDSFEKERECFAREMMSLIDMPLVSTTPPSTISLHSNCNNMCTSTPNPHMSGCFPGSCAVYVPPLDLDCGHDVPDNPMTQQCSTCHPHSNLECGVDLLQRELDNLKLQKCFGERRMAEILDDRTQALHCHIVALEEELRTILMNVENYMNDEMCDKFANYATDMCEMNSNVYFLEDQLSHLAQEKNAFADHICFLTTEFENLELGHNSTLIDIHKTYGAKLHQLASILHVPHTPVTSSCDCQLDSLEFHLCESNLLCMDRLVNACEGLINRIRTLESDVDSMNQHLTDKESIIRDLNHGVQLLSGENVSLRCVIDQLGDEMSSADHLEASRLDQLETIRRSMSRQEMQSRDMASRIREMESLLKCSHDEKLHLEALLRSRDDVIAVMREEERVHMMSVSNAMEAKEAEKATLVQLRNEAQHQLECERLQFKTELEKRAETIKQLQLDLNCTVENMRVTQKDCADLVFASKSRERALENQHCGLIGQLEAMRQKVCACGKQIFVYDDTDLV